MKNKEDKFRDNLREIKSYCLAHRKRDCESCILMGTCHIAMSCSEDLGDLAGRLRKACEDSIMAKKRTTVKKSKKPIDHLMDIEDILDELENIKIQYDKLYLDTLDKNVEYHASYSSIALGEAIKVIHKYVTDKGIVLRR